MALLHPSKTSTTLLFLPSLLLILLHFPSTTADPLYQICGTTGNYTTKSTYQSNLVHLLSSLASTNSSLNVSSTATTGQVPDQIYGLSLCRGDSNSSACLSCLNTAAKDIQQLCPYYKAATVWYDGCELRYSNQQFLSSPSLDSNIQLYMWNPGNITSGDERSAFNQSVNTLVTNMSEWAAYKSNRSFATAEMNFTAHYPKIYGLAQCAADLSAGECSRCLNDIANNFATNSYFEGRPGGRILGFWCNSRYEVSKFYDGTSTLSLASPVSNAPAPPVAPVLTPPANGSVGSGSNSKGKNVTGIVLAIVIPLVTALLVITAICICFWRRRRAIQVPKETNPEEITSIESLLFDLSTLRAATINFSDLNKLGEGGFGAVYKGTLPDGREIAVKRLSESSGQGLGELKNELVLVAKLQHRNLVRLLGVCLEEQEKLLIYEYVANRSLDTILFDPTRREQLDWGRRYKVIGGIARGLLYLHEDSQLKIIHRDLKASNILLDADMNPKISDFGLARLFGGDQTQGTTSRIVGTFGYMAPEYAMRGHFSIKSDVFSFGVLVLEIVTGKKNSGFFDSEHAEDLLSYTWEHWTNGTVTEIIDPSLGDHFPRSEVLRCIQIGLICAQEDPAGRPTMSAVVVMLNSYSVSLQAPSRPAFVIGKSGQYSDVSSRDFVSHDGIADRSSSKPIPMSPNEVTLSEVEPR